MFERFTDRGRRVVVLAHQEAAGVGDDLVGPEHLLLGLLSEGSSLAARLLVSAGLDYTEALTLVAEVAAGGESEALTEPRFTEAALEVFETAGNHATSLGHQFVTPEHLLLGLAEANSETLAAVFARLSVGASVLGDAVRRSISEDERKRIPPTGDVRDVPLGQSCGACGAAVQEHGRVKGLELGVEQRDPIHLQAYFCGECGSTIGLVKGQ